MAETLADKLKDFSTAQIKRNSIKIPKIKSIKKVKSEDRHNQDNTKNPKIAAKTVFFTDNSFLSDLLIRTAIEDAKNISGKDIEKVQYQEIFILPESEDKKDNIGGYGTISKSYAIVPSASYVDYGKLFSHLGNFRSQSAYESMGSNNGSMNNNQLGDAGKFSLIDRETMETGARHVRYFAQGNDISTLSSVPITGMNSAEWEEFKLWMKLDPVMYRLKTSTS